jgi:hypothetical protein
LSALAAIAVFPVLTLLLIGLSKAEGLLYAPGSRKNARTEPVYEPASEVATPAVQSVAAVAELAAPPAAPAGAVPTAPAGTPAPETRPLPRLRSVESSSLRKISLTSLNHGRRVHVEA